MSPGNRGLLQYTNIENSIALFFIKLLQKSHEVSVSSLSDGVK